jgi:hypothetical protein
MEALIKCSWVQPEAKLGAGSPWLFNFVIYSTKKIHNLHVTPPRILKKQTLLLYVSSKNYMDFPQILELVQKNKKHKLIQ